MATRKSNKSLESIVRVNYTATGAESFYFRATWEDDDPRNPLGFPPGRKVWLLFQMTFLATVSSFGSSVPGPAGADIAASFGVSQELAVLVVALYMLGWAFGPILWAPVGEVYGRRASMLPPVFVMGLFSIGSGFSPNVSVLLVTRFFAGIFASAPISNVAAAIGDIYTPKQRGIPMALYTAGITIGPCVAPIAGAAIVELVPGPGWRWTFHCQTILAFVGLAISSFGLPETYHPVLLASKANRMRRATRDDRWWHPHESEKICLSTIFTKYLSRPLKMLFTEPMCACIGFYASFIYGMMFFLIIAVQTVFHEQRGYTPVIAALPMLGPAVGVWFGLFVALASRKRYARVVAENDGRPVPEARLPPIVLGAILVAGGTFWFGWTASPRYAWALPTVAGGVIGAGYNIAFQQCLNFLVDTYGPYAASAIAGNTVLRSLLACVLPSAAKPMFASMGIGPGCSLLAGISCLAIPVPLILMRYGRRLRSRSEFATACD